MKRYLICLTTFALLQFTSLVCGGGRGDGVVRASANARQNSQQKRSGLTYGCR